MLLSKLMLLTASASAATSEAAGAVGQNNWTQIIFLLVLTVGLILVMVIPQKKRNKQIADMLNSIQPGSKVRTIGGIYGTVTVVKEDLVTIVSGPDNVKLVFAKGAIAVVEPKEENAQVSEDELEAIEEPKAEN